jgi:hypothetical protein
METLSHIFTFLHVGELNPASKWIWRNSKWLLRYFLQISSDFYNQSKHKETSMYECYKFTRNGWKIFVLKGYCFDAVQCCQMSILSILWPNGIFLAIWYIEWSFGIYFPVLVCCTEKNLATLMLSKMGTCPRHDEMWAGMACQKWVKSNGIWII